MSIITSRANDRVRNRLSAWAVPPWATALLMVVLMAGCEQPVNRVVVVVESPGFDPAAHMDRLVVSITASATASGTELCDPLVVSLPLVEDATTAEEPRPIALPISIAVEPGAHFDKLAILRVEGRLLDETVVYRHERLASLVGGDVRLKVSIQQDCINRGTQRGEFCHNGEVYTSAHWRIFDEGDHVREGVLCHRP